MSITGLPGQGPVRAGIAVSDSAAGHQLAIGILLALRERDRTGRGQWVKVSLLEAMISFLDFQAVRWTIDGQVPPQEGNHHPTGRPMGTYRAADGYLNVAAPGGRLWTGLCDVLGEPDLRRRRALRQRRRPLPATASCSTSCSTTRFATRPRDEWIALLDAAGVPCGPVNAIDEVFADPQVQHLAMLARIPHANRGDVDVLRNPITMSESRPVVPTASPVPGRPDGRDLRRARHPVARRLTRSAAAASPSTTVGVAAGRSHARPGHRRRRPWTTSRAIGSRPHRATVGIDADERPLGDGGVRRAAVGDEAGGGQDPGPPRGRSSRPVHTVAPDVQVDDLDRDVGARRRPRIGEAERHQRSGSVHHLVHRGPRPGATPPAIVPSTT